MLIKLKLSDLSDSLEIYKGIDRCNLCDHSNSDRFMCEDIMLSRLSSLVFHWCLHNKCYFIGAPLTASAA